MNAVVTLNRTKLELGDDIEFIITEGGSLSLSHAIECIESDDGKKRGKPKRPEFVRAMLRRFPIENNDDIELEV